MGFNRVIVDKEKIQSYYKTGGVEGVKKMFERIDAITYLDKESTDIGESLEQLDIEKAERLINELCT